MLHIVQVVLSGTAEMPRLFVDEAQAKTAFVECAKKYWAQSYAAYCERQGVGADSFSSAQTFVSTFDLADKSRIQYWSVTPEDSETSDGSLLSPCAEAVKKQQEQFLRMARDIGQSSLTVKDGLTELLKKIAELADSAEGMEVLPTAEQVADKTESATMPPSSAPPQEKLKESDEQYHTPEWKKYVESIMNMCGGIRSEYHLFTRYDWRQEVYSDLTTFEYWDWAAAKIDACIEKAKNAGYSVLEDPDHPGHFRFKTPGGIIGDVSSTTEGEAWCRAGLHSEG